MAAVAYSMVMAEGHHIYDKSNCGTHRYSVLSSQPTDQASVGDGEAYSIKSHGEGARHYHNSSVCDEGLCCALGIEQEILRHAETRAHADAVSLCLQLDIVSFRSIVALRKESPWQEQLKALYGSLFTSPPPDLFDLVARLRLFHSWDYNGLLERIRLLKTTTPKVEAGRTAPEGQAYECPSENCKKHFKKSGHAQNHVEKRHPEYLKIYPDYQPLQFMVKDPRSQSTSPACDRQGPKRASDKQLDSRHGNKVQQPTPNGVRGLAVSVLEGFDYPDLLSPRSLALSSSVDTEEHPPLTRSRSNSRPSPRQPKTPQSQETTSIVADRHAGSQNLTPPTSKRIRDPYSSTESIPSFHDTTRHTSSSIRRRPSKRHSTHRDGYLQF